MRIPPAPRFAVVALAVLLVFIGGCIFSSQAPTVPPTGEARATAKEAPRATLTADEQAFMYGTLKTTASSKDLYKNGKVLADGIFQAVTWEGKDAENVHDIVQFSLKGEIVGEEKRAGADGTTRYFLVLGLHVNTQTSFQRIEFTYRTLNVGVVLGGMGLSHDVLPEVSKETDTSLSFRSVAGTDDAYRAFQRMHGYPAALTFLVRVYHRGVDQTALDVVTYYLTLMRAQNPHAVTNPYALPNPDVALTVPFYGTSIDPSYIPGVST